MPLSTQVYRWEQANLMLGVTLWWISMPSREEKKYSLSLHAMETGMSSGLMSHLTRMQTLPCHQINSDQNVISLEITYVHAVVIARAPFCCNYFSIVTRYYTSLQYFTFTTDQVPRRVQWWNCMEETKGVKILTTWGRSWLNWFLAAFKMLCE